MPFVPVPKDLTKVKTKVAFNLTKRQIVCFGGGALIGIPTYLLTRGGIGNSAAVMLMIALMLPFFLFGIQSIDQSAAIKNIKRKITDLDAMKIQEQKKAVRAGYTGVTALDHAVAAMDLKKGLEHMQQNLQDTVKGAKEVIERGEQMGQELRSVGSHLKNAARAAVGKDLKPSDVQQAGHFQAAVLAPMRGVSKMLSGLNNKTLAAIGAVENLEQSADRARQRKTERAAQRSGKMPEKKPSIRATLQKNQAEIAAKTAAAQAREKKPREAAL